MLSIIPTAAAFAPTMTPVAPASRATPVRMAYENELGAVGPLTWAVDVAMEDAAEQSSEDSAAVPVS